MKTENIELYVKKLEEAGLKLHQIEDKTVHHFVIELNYKKEDEDDIMSDLPETFESVCENENKDGTCDGTFMFYLEDITESEAGHILDWLEQYNIWKDASDVPECVG